MSLNASSLHSLRGRLASFFAGVIAIILIVFAGAVYFTARTIEAEESEPQVEKDRELAHVRRLLFASLALGIPLGAGLAALGSAWMTRRSLRAMAAVVSTAGELHVDRLHQRIPIDPHDDVELKQMINALNQMLERVDRAVSGLRRFTQDAAHELRTPLAGLLSRLEICLRQGRDASSLRTTIEATLEDLAALQQLVEALLLLARSDAGELAVCRRDLLLRPLLCDLASLYSGIADERGLRLQLECGETLTLHSDGVLLGRAIANLLDNACKFSPDGGEIRLCAKREADQIQITVQDQGPGIPPQDCERVFERFYRSDEHRGHTAGFGLGLALTRDFVLALGGTVQLGRGPGGGTEAIVRLAGAS